MCKTKKILIILVVIAFTGSFKAKADEGMWLSSAISEQIGKMKKAGLKLSVEDIYSINKQCLKDAVIGLSTDDNFSAVFATGSFVSDKGLILTNYHPVIRYLERFSNEENDFLKYGYWSTKTEEESLCRDLCAIQLVKIIDVTNEIKSSNDSIDADDEADINRKGREVIRKYTKGTHFEAKISSFMGGTQYILSLYNVYKDVRMVAAPPMSLGKFAGDADNWSWPRHTADFSLLRVYANDKNEPAPYNKANKPLTGNAHLNISSKGVNENDFVMTIGFPARTKLHIPSFAIDYLENIDLPARIKIRSEKLRLINQTIEANPDVKFRYTARVNTITNNYLKWKGELLGLQLLNLTDGKTKLENELTAWINENADRTKKYGNIMEQQKLVYEQLKPYKTAELYFNEAGISGAEIVPFAGKFEKLVQMFERKKVNMKAVDGEVKRLKPLTDQFFQNWDFELDRQMYRNMLFLYYQNVDKQFISAQMTGALTQFNGDVDKYATYAFENSILTHKDKTDNFLAKVDSASINMLTTDPIYKLALSYYTMYTERVIRQMGKLTSEQIKLYNTYMQALVDKNGPSLTPDANRTQRVSYGKVTGYEPADAVNYRYYSTLDGLFEKHTRNAGNTDYSVPKKLKLLYDKKDFGPYFKNSEVRTCFVSNCHTSSGNSGSPVLNAKGELVGLNFDRVAEGIASDYKYQPQLSRAIAVDVRYILFLINNYSPSKYLINELTIKK